MEAMIASSDETGKNIWFVYILLCADETLYTGITNDLSRRMKQHEAGNGAKYMRGRAPFELMHTESFDNKGAALSREIEIKNLSRNAKWKLIQTE